MLPRKYTTFDTACGGIRNNIFDIKVAVSKKSLRACYTIIVKFVWQLYAQSDLRTQEVTEKVYLHDAIS